MIDKFALYDSLNIPVISGSLSWDDVNHKKEVNMSAWRDPSKRKCEKNQSGYALVMGGGIMAIDFDDPKHPEQVYLRSLLKNCNMIQKTKKGFHYLYRSHPDISTTTSVIHKIDIRAEGSLLFCEPSTYMIGNERVEYKWISVPEDGQTLQNIPDSAIAFLKNIGVVHNKDELVFDEVESDPKEISLILPHLDFEKHNSYSDWLKFGMICFNEDFGIDMWIKFSKRSPKYKEGECQKKWNTFEKGNLTVATLWNWLKEDNPIQFKELTKKRNDVWKLLEQTNQSDVAKFFYNLKPNSYMWSPITKWFELQPNNTWTNCKDIPHGLVYDITKTLQQTSEELRDTILITDEKAKDKYATITKFYKLMGTAIFHNGVIIYLQSYYNVYNLDKLINEKRHLFAFSDSLIDLETMETRPIEPSDLISITTGYSMPKKNHINNELMTFLNTLFDSEEMLKYVLTTLAYSMSGTKQFEEFYTWTGSGRNGKGVLTDLVKLVFGDYFYTIDISVLTQPTDGKDKPQPALVSARYARIVSTSEPASDDKLQVDLLKRISGGDCLDVRGMYSTNITSYIPQFSLIIQTNNIPSPSRPDQAFNARHRVVPFPHKFVDEPTESYHKKMDSTLKSKVKNWRDDFIMLIVSHYKYLKGKHSIPLPSAVMNRTAEYEDDNNPIKIWLNEHYTITNNSKDTISASILFSQYQQDGVGDLTQKRFAEGMVLNNILKKKKEAGFVYIGIKRV